MRYRLMSSSIAVLLFVASATSTQAQPRGARDTLSAADAALIAQGKQIVTTLCAACHTEQSPHKLAPPLSHVSQRYRMQLVHRDSALARMTAWIKEPARERALMPAMAIERFGLMAPLPIPEEQRRAAAAYVWSLSDGAEGMKGMKGMNGMKGMKGMEGMKGMDGMKGMEHGPDKHDTLATPPRKGQSIVP